MAKTIKPQTNLLLDIGLFALVVVHLTAALTVNIVLHDPGSAYETWHRVLGFTGVSLALVVTLHLRFHLAWIKTQFKRLLHSPKRGSV